MGKAKIDIEQSGIFILGISSIVLVGLHPDNVLQRYGFIVGLLSQPFWIYFSFRTKSWGIFWLSVIYTLSWINGIINNWGLMGY